MSNRFSSSSNSGKAAKGSWLLVEEFFEAGDQRFVDEICRIDDADRLGAFAKTWYSDHRKEARQLLREYLLRPLSHFRHEALVKRLSSLHRLLLTMKSWVGSWLRWIVVFGAK